MPRLYRLCLQCLQYLANMNVSVSVSVSVPVAVAVPLNIPRLHTTQTHRGTGTEHNTESRSHVVFLNDFIGKYAILKHMAPGILCFNRLLVLVC